MAGASFLPGVRLWGINHLAFYPVPLRIAGLVVAAASFWPCLGEVLFSAFRSLADALSGRRRIVLIVTIPILAFGAFIAFASSTELLGDGLYTANNIQRAARVDREVFHDVLMTPNPVYPGTEIINLTVSRTAARAFGCSPLAGVRVLNAFIGAVLVCVLLLAARPSPPRPGDSGGAVRAALISLALCSGAMQVFFGYIETYTPLIFFTGLYVLAVHRTLTRGAGLAWPAACAAAALLMHALACLLLPSLALVICWVASKREWSGRFDRACLVLAVVTIGAPFVVADVIRLDRFLLPILGNAETYGVLSISHMVDVINELVLLFPGIAVLGAAAAMAVGATRRSVRESIREPRRAGGVVAPGAPPSMRVLVGLFLTLPSLLFLLFFKPELGLARDWDLFAIAGAGPYVLVYAVLGSAEIPPACERLVRRVLPPLFAMSVVLFVSWIGVNADPARSAARFDGILSYDRSRAGYAYESLATLYDELGETVGEIRALEKAVDASPNPRYLYKLGVAYHDIGEREKAAATFDRCLRMRPEFDPARDALVQLLFSMKRYNELLRVAEEGERIHPRRGAYPFFMGKAYVELGRVPEAVSAFDRCRALNPPPEVTREIDAIVRSLGPAEKQ
jgi:hypothetical protein